jgi:hypothetical protein
MKNQEPKLLEKKTTMSPDLKRKKKSSMDDPCMKPEKVTCSHRW